MKKAPEQKNKIFDLFNKKVKQPFPAPRSVNPFISSFNSNFLKFRYNSSKTASYQN